MNWERAWVMRLYRVLPRKVTARIIRMAMPTYPIGVVAVVFNGEGEVLILRHTYHNPPWRLPGGLLERGEEVTAAAVREVYEEARCRIRPLGVIDAHANPYTFDVAVLALLHEEEPFQPGVEVTERRWVPPKAAVMLPSDHRRFLEAALRCLQ
jgi:ADP-ribose pyrophosphatase YjhB (NUDIX family)